MVFRDEFFGCFCGGQLQARKARDYTVRSCPQCGGAWVDHGDLRHMLQIMEDPGRKAHQLIKYTGQQSKRACPACKQPMGIVWIAGGTELDECKQHGVWFDRTELATVLYAFMESES